MHQTMLEAGFLQEDGAEVTETDLDFDLSVGPEDMDFDDFKYDAEDVTETGESLEEEEAPEEDKQAKREAHERRKAVRNASKRRQEVMDEIDQRTERGSRSSAAHVTMKDLESRIRELNAYDAKMEATITASLLSGATVIFPETDAAETDAATSEATFVDMSLPAHSDRTLYFGDKESRRRQTLEQYRAKRRARNASFQHEKDLLMAMINKRTCGSRKATKQTSINELEDQLARLDDRDNKTVESVRARLISEGRL
ncbi:hypothetical protein I350_05719 [Cryptococcus amylolentus CBS 6273]|uniref:Uncharacterized protein n=1 Tax=Cryptococcus amylolentus CBS 6273 TaxID=1296118 RepID=A0A1E3JPT6_9TREE|nr:hypothetical protein I350_05719 [Cryptococcus amylolentus CBS 6273]